jgi:malate permease and related proteins
MSSGVIDIGTILAPLFTITAAVAAGFFARALGFFKAEEALLITRIVMTVLMPVFVFSAIVGINSNTSAQNAKQITFDTLKIPFVAFLVISFCGIIAFVVGKFVLRLNRQRMGAFLLTSMFGSTGFIGLPLVNGIFPNSESGRPSPMILEHAFYSELGSLTLLVTLGVLIASYYGERTYGEKPKFNWRSLLDVPKNGPFLGLILGLLFFTINIPKPVVDTLSFLGQATLPMMMFSLGLTIMWKDFRKNLAAVFSMSMIKLVLAPLIAILFCQIFGLNQSTTGVVVLNASTPAIIICLIYATQYKLDREFASTAVFSSFFFCLLTIPLIIPFILSLSTSK